MSAQHDLEADLDAYVIGDEDWNDDGDIEPPEDPAGASRLLGKVRAYERTIEGVEQVTAARVADFHDWCARRTGMARRQIARIELSLEQWMRSRHDSSGGKIKTEHLPDGELKMRVRNRTLVVTDSAAAELFARFGSEHRHWIRAKFEIDKTVAREDITVGDVVSHSTLPEDGYEWRQAIVDGRGIVPGLLIHEPVTKKFSYKTARTQEETP